MNQIIAMLDDIRHQQEVDGIHGEYGDVIDAWEAHSAKLTNKVNKTQSDFNEMLAVATKLNDAVRKLLAVRDTLVHERAIALRDGRAAEAKLSTLGLELSRAQRDNAMNYAEKKAMAAYAREMRNASGASPVFEPLLYAGERGNWVRERIRIAGVRVFNAGGDLMAVANAAIHEMHQHVQFVSPSEERLQEITLERLNMAGLSADQISEDIDPKVLAQKCPDVRPI